MRSNLLALLLLLTASWAHAQSDPKVFRPTQTNGSTTEGRITIHQSDRINGLMTDYGARKRSLKGYRVQIYLGDRNTAEEMRRSFLVKYPDVPAYLSYLAPNFRVRVGDQRDRISAEKLRDDLRTQFPGLYVVPDDIEQPRLTEAR